MTQTEMYSLIVKIALVTGVVFFVISLILFFRLKIMKVIGDLTGQSAKKGIKRNKEDVIKKKQQELEASKKRKEAMDRKEKLKADRRASAKTEQITEKISNETTVLGNDTNETTVLGSSTNETTVLGYNASETSVLGGDDTVVLSTASNSRGTEKLGDTEVLTSSAKQKAPKADSLEIEDEITVVNSDLII